MHQIDTHIDTQTTPGISGRPFPNGRGGGSGDKWRASNTAALRQKTNRRRRRMRLGSPLSNNRHCRGTLSRWRLKRLSTRASCLFAHGSERF
jgi:hypothetical protein